MESDPQDNLRKSFPGQDSINLEESNRSVLPTYKSQTLQLLWNLLIFIFVRSRQAPVDLQSTEGVKLNASSATQPDQDTYNQEDLFPLHAACFNGDLSKVKELLEINPLDQALSKESIYPNDSDILDSQEKIPLDHAVSSNYPEIVQLLLDQPGSAVSFNLIENAINLSVQSAILESLLSKAIESECFMQSFTDHDPEDIYEKEAPQNMIISSTDLQNLMDVACTALNMDAICALASAHQRLLKLTRPEIESSSPALDISHLERVLQGKSSLHQKIDHQGVREMRDRDESQRIFIEIIKNPSLFDKSKMTVQDLEQLKQVAQSRKQTLAVTELKILIREKKAEKNVQSNSFCSLAHNFFSNLQNKPDHSVKGKSNKL